MTYFASVRDKDTKQIIIIRGDEYTNKNNFMKDLRHNGYIVRHNFIFTENQWEYFLNYDFNSIEDFKQEIKKHNIK